MQKLLIGLVRAYRYLLSPLLGNNCRYYPSCSEYAEEAVREHGAVHGGWLALKRISRCHPWHEGGFDPVPLRGAQGAAEPGSAEAGANGHHHCRPAAAAQQGGRFQPVRPRKQEQRQGAVHTEPSMPVLRPIQPTNTGPTIPCPAHSGPRPGSGAGQPKKD